MKKPSMWTMRWMLSAHGVGALGALATGIFATVAVNTAGPTGCWTQPTTTQAIAVPSRGLLVIMTFIILKR